jgi:hypothetical protein
VLVVGLSKLGAPFKGGTLVPSPSFMIGDSSPARPASSLPDGPRLPPGFPLWMQSGSDAGGRRASSSNGLGSRRTC